MSSRAYTQREWRLLSWWLATFHPNAVIAMNVKLGPTRSVAPGPIPIQNDLEQSRVANRWVDAIFSEGGSITLVEAKLEPDPGIFSQLLHYLRRFRADPAYAQYKTAPVDLVALVNRDDPSVAEEAPFYGIRWEVFQPDLSTLPPASKTLQFDGLPEVELPHDWPARLQSWGVAAISRER